METRIVLALCLVLFSALCGKTLGDGVRRRAATLRQLSEGVRRLRVHMMSMFEPVQAALEHADDPLLTLIAGGMSGGVSAGEAWRSLEKKSTRRGGPADSLIEADRQILTRLFDGLGQTGREEQDLLLTGVVEALDRQQQAAQVKAGEADRLYLSLGLLIGLMLALIVI